VTRVAGIMSGTSLDGIDVAIVDIGPRYKLKVLAFSTTPYPKAVRNTLLAVSNANCHTADIARLHFLLPELYAEAFNALCKQARVPIKTVSLIGCHGQTIFHEGDPVRFVGRSVASTLQIGNGAILAARTGIPTVTDFRSAHIAVGGKGAPLVPHLDHLLFRHPRRTRVSLNIGGVANITAIPSGIAFDTGPGNMVMDNLVRHFTNGRQTFDRDGGLAARGHIQHRLLNLLLRDPYYRRQPPKTAGREQYGQEFLTPFLSLSCEDAVATATALTVATIVKGIRLTGVEPQDLIVGGGGAQNPQLMGLLAAQLPNTRVLLTNDFGIDSDAKEAVAFAVLAYECVHLRPALGAVLGAIYPPN